MRDWATRIRNGDLSARVAPEARIYLGDLVNDINHLGDSLQTLSLNMEQEVQRQTVRLAQKTNSLQVLYFSA